MDCCPLVVDPLTYAALIGFIGLATYFFREFIAMSMLMMARKKRRKRELNLHSDILNEILDTFSEGKLSYFKLIRSSVNLNCQIIGKLR